jgi:hypothetical protein
MIELSLQYCKKILIFSKNQLGINTSKTKEMIIAFGSEPEIDKLSMNGTEIWNMCQ